jgi:hypothetical protein
MYSMDTPIPLRAGAFTIWPWTWPVELDAMANDWVWPVEEIRRVGYRVVDQIAEHLASLPQRPVFAPFPAEQAERMLASAAPEQGESADAVLDAFAREIEPYPSATGIRVISRG